MDGETLPAEIAWVADNDLEVYQNRFKPMLFVVLDNPRLVRLPFIGVPCVEFQWHDTFPFDISTRRLIGRIWG